MCGIAGYITVRPAEPNRATLERMTDTIRHRGPDDEQRAAQANAGNGLVHEELRQPQTDIGAERPRYIRAGKDSLPDPGVRHVGSHLEQEGEKQPSRLGVPHELGEGHLLAVVCGKHHHSDQEAQPKEPRDPTGESF